MRVDYTIPQKWNDLSDWQVRMIGRFMFNNRNERIESNLMKMYLITVLFQNKPSLKRFLKVCILFWDVPFSELEQYTNFIFDKKDLLTVFPKYIKVGRWPWSKKVYGPMARLANITIEELSYADTFFYKWVTEKDINDLHRLCAILYRSADPNASQQDIRVEFSSLLLEKNAEVTDAIPLHIKYMIACAYEGCRDTLINRYKHVFPQRKAKPESEAKEQKPKPYQSFSKIITAMAMDEVQIFGNYQNARKVLAPEFLAVYDESIVREKEKERNRQKK